MDRGCLFLDDNRVRLHVHIDADRIAGGTVLSVAQFMQRRDVGDLQVLHIFPVSDGQHVDRDTGDRHVAVDHGLFVGIEIFVGDAGRVLDVDGIGQFVQDARLCTDAGKFGVEKLGRKGLDAHDCEFCTGFGSLLELRQVNRHTC